MWQCAARTVLFLCRTFVCSPLRPLVARCKVCVPWLLKPRAECSQSLFSLTPSESRVCAATVPCALCRCARMLTVEPASEQMAILSLSFYSFAPASLLHCVGLRLSRCHERDCQAMLIFLISCFVVMKLYSRFAVALCACLPAAARSLSFRLARTTAVANALAPRFIRRDTDWHI